MKTLHFLALLAISAAFLSCGTTDTTDPDVTGIGSPKCKIAAKQGEGYKEVPEAYTEWDSYKGLDELDPSCKSDKKEFFFVYDTNTINPPSGWDKPEDYDSCIGLPSEEGTACAKDIKDKKGEYLEQWRSEHQKRDLPIPCVAFETVTEWGAWLTDEEVAELEEVYSVNIYGQPEYSVDTVDDSNAVPPPTTASDGCGK